MTAAPTLMRSILVGLTTLAIVVFGAPLTSAAPAPAASVGGVHAQITTTTNPCPRNLDAVQTPQTYGWLGGKHRITDTTTGLTQMGERIYNSTTGTFLTTDPIYGGNANPYNYPTDPISGFDLTGTRGGPPPCGPNGQTCVRVNPRAGEGSSIFDVWGAVFKAVWDYGGYLPIIGDGITVGHVVVDGGSGHWTDFATDASSLVISRGGAKLAEKAVSAGIERFGVREARHVAKTFMHQALSRHGASKAAGWAGSRLAENEYKHMTQWMRDR